MAVEAYLADRDALIARERSLRPDAPLQTTATPLERRASNLLSILRSRCPTLDPDFIRAKSTIASTELFKIFQSCPKGALLHGHLDAMASTDFLLSAALEHQSLLWVKADRQVTTDDIADRHADQPVQVVFEWRPRQAEVPEYQGFALTDDGYEGAWVPVKHARDHFLGGPSAFDAFILVCLSLPSQPLPSSKHTWWHFIAYFALSNSLLDFKPVFSAYIAEILRIARSDKIAWLELRMNFFTSSAQGNLGSVMLDEQGGLVGHDEQLSIIGKTVQHAKEMDPGFWGLKIIYSTVRFVKGTSNPSLRGFESASHIRDYMTECLALKQRHPDLITGFDLVGQEDTGISLVSYLEDLLWFQHRQKELGVEVPLVLHAGETAHEGSPADQNLFDAIMLGTKRIGHGFSLVHHPEVMRLCRERRIVVESCPISNQLLGYTASQRAHPLPILLANGVPTCLSSDDPAVFQNHGLSFDLFQFYFNTSSFDLISVKGLLKASLEASMIKDKEARVRDWEQAWHRWIQEVVEQLD